VPAVSAAACSSLRRPLLLALELLDPSLHLVVVHR